MTMQDRTLQKTTMRQRWHSAAGLASPLTLLASIVAVAMIALSISAIVIDRERTQQDAGCQVPQHEFLRDKIASGGAQRERKQDRQPIERFAAIGEHRMDRKRFFTLKPQDKCGGERDRKHDRCHQERYVKIVDHVVGDQGPHDANQYH